MALIDCGLFRTFTDEERPVCPSLVTFQPHQKHDRAIGPRRTMMLLADIPVVVVAVFAMMFLFAVIVLAVMFRYYSIWFQAFMSGAPISLFEIIGMRFRRTNVNAVVRA